MWRVENEKERETSDRIKCPGRFFLFNVRKWMYMKNA